MSHTPTPWHTDPNDYAKYVWGQNNEMVLQLRGYEAGLPKRANAEFIVRAVNSHDALLEACRRVIDSPFEPDKWRINVEQAIKLAEEGQP